MKRQMLYRSMLCSFIARTAIREENKRTRGILIKTISQRVVRIKFKTLLQMHSPCYSSIQLGTKANVKMYEENVQLRSFELKHHSAKRVRKL